MRKIATSILAGIVGLSLIAAPANGTVNSEVIEDCGLSSTTFCIESFQLSVDGGATWESLSSVPGATKANMFTPYSIAGTRYESPIAGIDALAIQATRIEVRQDAQTPFTTNNGIQTVVIAADLDSWNVQNTPKPPIDPRATFRITLRIGSFNPTYTVGQMSGIVTTTTFSSEYNKLVLQGKPIEMPQIENQTIEICASPIAVAEKTIYQMQTMTFDFLDMPTMWKGVDVAYDGSCGYNIDFTAVENSPYPGLYFTSSGPHFYPDGQTLNIGHVEAVLPASFLTERMGLTQDSALAGGLTATTRYVPGVDSPASFTVTPEPNGAVRVIVDGFHFSSPTIVLKRPKAGTPVVKQISASLPFRAKRSSAQVAQIFGMNPPPKSKITLSVSRASSRAKICSASGSKLTVLKKAGPCTLTVKVQPPKPAAVTASGSISFVAGQKMNANSVAAAIGMSVPPKSKVSVTIGQASRKLCTAAGGGVKAKAATSCSVKVKVQAPVPPAYAQTSTINIG